MGETETWRCQVWTPNFTIKIWAANQSEHVFAGIYVATELVDVLQLNLGFNKPAMGLRPAIYPLVI